jgi:hypothetical protein
MPSTAIKAISHDAMTDALFVTFVDGDTYAYQAVPLPVFQAFRAARSKGRFFAYEIRNRYRYRRLDRPDEAEPSPSAPSGGPASPPPAGAAHSA